MLKRVSQLIHTGRRKLAPYLERLLPTDQRYLNPQRPGRDWGSPETFFESESGSLPVFPGYRYATKRCWSFFGPLNFISQLRSRGLATEADVQFLDRCVGTRTLQVPLDEITAYATTMASEHSDALLPGSESSEPALQPTESETLKRINYHARSHRNLLRDLREQGFLDGNPDLKVLEIGFISGGHSLYAFEKLGCSVTGIDNGYGGLENTALLPEFLKTQTHSTARFVSGDITETTELEADSFDIVYSSSVLEHIHDIPDALAEMLRLLKPGGLLLHKYHPFFCPTGGHSLGILDAPWGHCRLSPSDFRRYLEELRPLEAGVSVEWTEAALNRAYPISAMQRAIVSSGAEILLWRESDIPASQLLDLTPETLQSCIEVTPQIGLTDLITEGVLFVARRSE
jgi:SAM-dependent methyltransferase